MGLAAAHKGYRYQDIFVALHLAHALIDEPSKILIDKKLSDPDDFDDLTLTQKSGFYRFQLKHSENPSKELAFGDFHQSGDLSMASLVKSFISSGSGTNCRHRAVVTWQVPTDPKLTRLLVPMAATDGPLSKFVTTYQFDPKLVWPESGEPVFTGIRQSGVSRQQFIDFCSCFSIECGAPAASLDPSNPGTIEDELLSFLSDRIGIGATPNNSSTVLDVASRLIEFATINREKEVTTEDVIMHLKLRTDFGSIPQLFPIVRQRFVARDTLEKDVLTKRLSILIGPPGSGKSWFLGSLAESLIENGESVIQHLCFIDPIDELMQRRIDLNTFCGNLIGDIVRSFPNLRGRKSRLLAAELKDLQELLDAIEADKRVTIIVDGLDHIPRIKQQLGQHSRESEILEAICSLKIPTHIRLVVGSQPGPHVDRLVKIGAEVIEIPRWNLAGTIALAEKMKLPLLSSLEESDKQNLLREVNGKADGNVLYCTYILQTLAELPVASETTQALRIINELPACEGNLEKYYAHLLSALNAEGGPIVDIFAFVFFGLTIHELQEIFPIALDRIEGFLKAVHPVLVSVKGQGGFRVYHESFRRFLFESIEKRGQNKANILKPVIQWLEKLGFYESSRSFRYLLPTLQQAGEIDKILNFMTRDYATLSLFHFQPRSAIQRNIALAAQAAAGKDDWIMLVRLAALSRMLNTAFEERLLDMEGLVKTYLRLHPPALLVERLLDNGNTTFDGHQGLLICSLLDDEGCVPPWREYLVAEDEEGELNIAGIEDLKEKISLERVHGLLRLDDADEIRRSVLDFVLRSSNREKVTYCSSLIARLARHFGSDIYDEFFERAKSEIKSPEILSKIRMNFIAGLVKEGRKSDAVQFVSKYSSGQLSEEEVYSYLTSGLLNTADLNVNYVLPAYNVTREHIFQQDAPEIRAWTFAAGVSAFTNPEQTANFGKTLPDDGWYHRWLYFTVELSLLEAGRKPGQKLGSAAIASLEKLAANIEPFAGKPRACDLYGIEGAIQATLKRALMLADDVVEAKRAIELLNQIADGTTTFLQGDSMGPLTKEALVDLLADWLPETPFKEEVLASIQELTAEIEGERRFFDIQSIVEQKCLAAEIVAGKTEMASRRWKTVCEKLVGYGFRKDMTIFESVESISALTRLSPEIALASLEKVQPLIDSVVNHTDGKETRHAPATWFRCLSSCDPRIAMSVLAECLSEDGGDPYYRYENGLDDFLEEVSSQAHPILTLGLRLLQSPALSRKSLESAISELRSLRGRFPAELVESLTNLLLTKVLDQHSSVDEQTVTILRNFIREYCPDQTLQIEGTLRPVSSAPDYSTVSSFRDEPESVGLSQMSVAEIETYCGKPLQFRSVDGDSLANKLGYRLLEIQKNGQHDDVIRVLNAIGSRYSGASTDLLNLLAEGFERHGFDELASICNVYAFTRHGHSMWSLGDKEALDGVRHSFDRLPDRTRKTLSAEFGRMVAAGYASGIGKGVVDVCAYLGDTESAKAAWHENVAMLEVRLAGNNESPTIFLPLQDAKNHPTVDHALAAAIYVRLSYPERNAKLRAATIISILWETSGEFATYGLRCALKADSPSSSLVIALQVTAGVEARHLQSIDGETLSILEQYAQCDHYGLANLAARILKKVYPNRSFVPTLPTNIPFSTIDATRNRPDAELLDVTGIAHSINEASDGFLDHALSRFGQTFTEGSSIHKRFMDRAKAAYNRSERRLMADLYGWEHETFETAAYEELTNLYYALWKDGSWTSEVEASVSEIIDGKVATYLSIEKSRIPRPAIPAPTEPGDIIVFPNSVPKVSGWKILALQEVQHTTRTREETHLRLAGIDFGNRCSIEGGLPFLDPLGRECRNLVMPSNKELSLEPIRGPIVFVETLEGRFNQRSIFSLESNLITRLGLSEGSAVGPLTLCDDNGPAIRYFNWIGPLFKGHGGLDEDRPQFFGCCLIIRPDVMDRLQSLAGAPAVMVTRT